MENETITLEAARDNGCLRISLSRPDDAIWSYEDLSAPLDMIEVRCREIIETLNRSNRTGNANPDVPEQLKAAGRRLCDDLLTPKIKKQLRETTAANLILKLDDRLVHIPWELLCVDEDLLCLRFNMGRLVRTRQEIEKNAERRFAKPFRMWVLADPCGDLAGADSEGVKIYEYADAMNRDDDIIDAEFDSEVTPDELKSKMRTYDFVHFAGHVEYFQDKPGSSGWKLRDGNLTANDIYNMSGGSAMPTLVFSNACQSARTEVWERIGTDKDEAFGLANAFMVTGVRHYIGTFWEIADEPGSRFALEFYKNLFSGMTTGESVRLARQRLTEKNERGCWAGYLLYGDPTVRYFKTDDIFAKPKESLPGGSALPTGGPTRSSLRLGFRGGSMIPIIGLICVALLCVWLALGQHKQKRTVDNGKSVRELALKKKELLNKSMKDLENALKEFEETTGTAISATHAEPVDEWTSTPLTLAMDFDTERCFSNNDRELLVSTVIGKALMEQTRTLLVARISLDTIMEELTIANSRLVSPKNRLRPDFFSPRLVLFFEVDNSETFPLLLMHLAETKRRQVMDFFIEPLGQGSLLSQKEKLAKQLVALLTKKYPLRGRIISMDGESASLNIGGDTGVGIGQKFNVIEKNMTLEIVSRRADESVARVVKGEGLPEIGRRVEAMNRTPSDGQNRRPGQRTSL